MNLKFTLSLLCMVFCMYTMAQSNYNYTDSTGTVKVKKDMRMDVLANKQTEINKRAAKMSSSGHFKGFRLQVYSGQNRDEANALKAELLRRFPDQKAYLLYQSPNFRVRIGNFLTQKEAADFRKFVTALYPQRGIYIVQDLIEYTPPDDEELF